MEKLDKFARQLFLMHGTNPFKLPNILFPSIDPSVAADKLFGRGVDFP